MSIYTTFQQYNINLKKSKYADLYDRLTSIDESHLGYTESHHIVPRSLGGTDDKNNLIKISARKHFLCHYLLCKMLPEKTQGWYSMVKAFNMMNTPSSNQARYFNSKLYEYAKKHMSEVMSDLQSGTNNSQYGTCWIYNHFLDTSCKIQKHLLPEYIEQGWASGRSSIREYAEKTKARSSRRKPYQSTMLLIHNKTHDIITVPKYMQYEYYIDGFINLYSPEYKQKPKKHYTKNGVNISVPDHIGIHLIQKGWTNGLHNPNHKGTSGKTYKWIDGRKVFNP